MGRVGTVDGAAIVACAAVVALLTWVGSAEAAAPWRSLQTSGQLNISDLVGTARGPDGSLHVAWHRRTSNGLYDLMQTPVAAGGAVGSPTPIVTGWASVEGPTLLASGKDLFAFFSGTQTLVTGDPHEGVDFAISGDNGASWALSPTAIAAGARSAHASMDAHNAPRDQIPIRPTNRKIPAAGLGGHFTQPGGFIQDRVGWNWCLCYDWQ